MTKRGILPGIRVVEGECANARGAVAHPCAEADNPGGVILHGGEGCVGGRAVAHVFDEQGRRAVLLGNFADVGNAIDGVSADAQEDVAGLQSAVPRGADTLLYVRQADNQYAVCPHGNAERLPAGNQPLLRADFHLHAAKRDAEDAQQQFRRAAFLPGYADVLAERLVLRRADL